MQKDYPGFPEGCQESRVKLIGVDNVTEAARQARNKYQREYREKNLERIRAYRREWARKNPEKIKEYRARYWESRAQEMEEE